MARFNPENIHNARMNGRTALYRLYDADGQLLYVGITNNPTKRFRFHAGGKLWWHLVADKKIEWKPSRQEAIVAEEAAERLEKPRYGDVHRLGTGWRTKPRSEDDEVLKRALAETVNRMRDAILRGVHPVGQRMPRFSVLASQYGVSRVMARAALRQLDKEGVLAGFATGATTVCALPKSREQAAGAAYEVPKMGGVVKPRQGVGDAGASGQHTVIVPVGEPREAARILRETMSPEQLAVLLAFLAAGQEHPGMPAGSAQP